MFALPLDTPWVFIWLGIAFLIGLLLGWLASAGSKDRLQRAQTEMREALEEAIEGRRIAEEASSGSTDAVARLEAESDSARESLADADREIERLRSDLEGAQAQVARLESEQSAAAEGTAGEAEALRRDLAVANETAEGLRAALSAAGADSDARLAAAEAEAREALARAAAAEEALSGVRLEREAVAGELEAAEAEAGRVRAELQQTATRLLDTEERLGELDDASAVIADLRERLAGAEARLAQAAGEGEDAAALGEKLDAAEATIGELHEQLAAADTSQHTDSGAAGPSENGAARDHLIQELQERVEELSGVEDRLRAREAELGELRRVQGAVVAAKDGEIRGLRERLEALEHAPAPEPAPAADIGVVAELEAVKSELAAAQERALHWEREAAALRAEAAAAATAPEPVAAPEPERPAAVPTGDVDTALAAMQEALDDKEARIAYLAERLARLERRIAPPEASPEPAPPPKPAMPEPPRDEAPVVATEPDDLTAVWGVGPAIERKLNALGITTFEQIALLTPEDVDWLGDVLGDFLDRIEADDWMGQARRLIKERGGTVPDAPGEPIRLSIPTPAEPDDLQQISGIGPFIEETLQGLGVTSFAQIAAWSPEDVARIGEALVIFQGRIEREGWVEQARGLLGRG